MQMEMNVCEFVKIVLANQFHFERDQSLWLQSDFEDTHCRLDSNPYVKGLCTLFVFFRNIGGSHCDNSTWHN